MLQLSGSPICKHKILNKRSPPREDRSAAKKMTLLSHSRLSVTLTLTRQSSLTWRWNHSHGKVQPNGHWHSHSQSLVTRHSCSDEIANNCKKTRLHNDASRKLGSCTMLPQSWWLCATQKQNKAQQKHNKTQTKTLAAKTLTRHEEKSTKRGLQTLAPTVILQDSADIRSGWDPDQVENRLHWPHLRPNLKLDPWTSYPGPAI
jgi:hypothetical protein